MSEREPIPGIPQWHRAKEQQKMVAEMTQAHIKERYDVDIDIETCYQYLLWCQMVVIDRLDVMTDGQIGGIVRSLVPELAMLCGGILRADIVGEFAPPFTERYTSPAEFEIHAEKWDKQNAATMTAPTANHGHGTYL